MTDDLSQIKKYFGLVSFSFLPQFSPAAGRFQNICKQTSCKNF